MTRRIQKDPQKYLKLCNDLRGASWCQKEQDQLSICLNMHPNQPEKCIEYMRLVIVCNKNRGVVVD